MLYLSRITIAGLFIGLLSVASCKSPSSKSAGENANPSSSTATEDSSLLKEYDFRELRTNFSKHAIPLDSIRDGGVSKNGIPAIDFPEFISVEAAHSFLTDPDYGILLQGKNQIRFYPFNILNWHEVVNDVFEGRPVVITFCPLCGSAIVYDRMVEGDTLQFGVSGKLFESNLLMFDDKNESLWSQSLGEAVAGDYTGKKLQLVDAAVLSYGDVIELFPSAEVLSPKTGFGRNYTQSPYGDYMSSDDIYFPVSQTSDRFPMKEMMYVVASGEERVAFRWLALLEQGKASVKLPSGMIDVTVKNGIPSASINGNSLPGYFSFWFSWYAHYGKTGQVWDK